MPPYQESSPAGGSAWALALGLGYVGSDLAATAFNKPTAFSQMNPGLVSGMMRTKDAAVRKNFVSKYYSSRYSSNYDKFMSTQADKAYAGETFKTAERLSEKKFASAASSSFMKRRAGAVASKLTGVGTFLMLAPMLYGMSYHGFKGIQRLGYELERPELGGHLTLTTAAFTDRQRAMQAIHNSEYNGRSAIGQEAFLLHR